METPRDGRVRRGERNRQLIVDALFELMQEGVLQPTAERVAQRAGVGTRTVFRHFDDMESLFLQVSDRIESEVRPIAEGPPIEGSRAERVRALIGRRVRLFERITPFRRAGDLHKAQSRVVQQRHVELNRFMRSQLVSALGPEIETAAEETLEALDLITSFEAWERLRSDQRLGRDRAARVIEESVHALLTSIRQRRV